MIQQFDGATVAGQQTRHSRRVIASPAAFGGYGEGRKELRAAAMRAASPSASS